MPLPPAPTKRAALLSTDAFDAPARSPSKAARKTENAESDHRQPVTELLEFFDGGTATGGDHHAAFMDKKAHSPIKTGVVNYKKESTFAPPPIAPKAAIRPKKTSHTGPAKLFVLDTNVLDRKSTRLNSSHQ